MKLQRRIKIGAFAAFMYGCISPVSYAKGERSRCEIKKGISVSNLGPHRFQGISGYCYGFTATRALEQLICRKKSSSCSKDEEHLSVFDTLRSSDGKLQEGGDTNYLLISLSTSLVPIARESCAPFDVLKLDEGRGKIDRMVREFQGFSQDFSHASDSDPCPHAREILKLLPWGQLEEIASLLVEFAPAPRGKDRFLGKVLVPKHCEKTAVQLPSFRVGRLRADLPLTAERIHETLLDNALNNIPTIWNYCKEATADGHCEDGHSVLITGARQLCCIEPSESCTWQYQISDSLKREQGGEGDWMDEEKIVSRTLFQVSKTNYNGRVRGQSEDRNFYYSAFQWLE